MHPILRRLASAVLAAALAWTGAAPARAVTDDEVQAALRKGKEYLISQHNGNGSFGQGGQHGEAYTALIFTTLAYMGVSINSGALDKGLDHVLTLNETSFGSRPGYALPIRCMGLSYVHNRLLETSDRRNQVRQRMMEDILKFQIGQTQDGGWRYMLNASGWDFSVTQWPLLAMRDASLVGIEIPEEPLKKARKLYYEKQKADGGWNYGAHGDDEASYGSMSAAGVASVYIIADLLDPGAGCPCQGGRSSRLADEAMRRVDNGLDWLAKNFTARTNPGKGGRTLYWLYCVERVGIAAGYKYFGDHNWYAEGAEQLVRTQSPDGAWGNIPDTCFALLFLYKGRSPILINKLKFDGQWNMHRRDVANLTQYIYKVTEQRFHWQIVELRAPLDELHDAPILYLSAESVPAFTDEEKAKLRAFTDTGGTILIEASCGNPSVRSWFTGFAREVWPEWALEKVGKDHPLWTCLEKMRSRPDLMHVHDGVRSAVFFSPDDFSCAWNTKAYASKAYLFDWGRNLHIYATDHAPMRVRLTAREPTKRDRHTESINAGAQSTVRVARLRHGGNWAVGANYKGFDRLAKAAGAAGVSLQVTEPQAAPFTEGGVAAGDLASGGHDVAYLTGSETFTLTDADRAALKAFVSGGGMLWAESATGSVAFHQALMAELGKMGLTAKLLPQTHGLLTGRMGAALGRNVASRVQFTKALRVPRVGRPYAELWGIFDGERMVGVFSPLDVMFALTPYNAYGNLGYSTLDAEAVATNVVLYATTR